MQNLYSKLTTDDLWLIKETEWVKVLQPKRESQFALGNGYLGTRGVLEDIPYGATPGTYLSGVYDKIGSQVDEIVNLPNPVNFRFTIEGHKLDVTTMDVCEYRRVLNMKRAVLLRRTLYRDIHKRRYDYQSLRFLSLHNKNIGVMQVSLTALDSNCVVDVNTGIDTSVVNAQVLSEGDKKHFRIRELGQQEHAGYLMTETLERKFIIIFWSGFYYAFDGERIFAKDNIFQLKLKKGRTVTFTKVFFIKHFPCKKDHAGIKAETFNQFKSVFCEDFNLLLRNHMQAWERLWKKADILIKGTANIQQNMRFNIYHMLICGQNDNGFSSIGARTLSGEGYRGHVFWDTELFLLPFYIFTFPEVAKSLILYRYRRLNSARKLAAAGGYCGAQFPWESAAKGDEQTPAWARDINGKIIRIHTHKLEHHITADIAYSAYKYYVVTGDQDFMDRYGYEIIFEAARFWASRVLFDKRKGRYDIPNVIGPDEFHLDVKNNAFTNIMARWNLELGGKLFYRVKKEPVLFKKIKDKLVLKNKEAAEWKRIASLLGVSKNKDNVIEQFDGYFKLKRVVLAEKDENDLPIIPEYLGTKDLNKTQAVKQADVVMLFALFEDMFDIKTKKINYDFYLARTLHKSSLSAAVHSLVASDIKDLHRSYIFFNVALHSDISNIYGNTDEGIHGASLGGTWQAVVFGFAGIKIKHELLSIDPYMPKTWRGIIFSFLWRKDHINLRVTNNSLEIKFSSSRNKHIQLYIFGEKVSFPAGKWVKFARQKKRSRKIYF